ncbi:MAG TPA: hypothetical protein PLB89_01045 [Flavobacteriales bacterium]|nr:hypothetical protein [Flavobacteriales bacterium]
MLAAQPYDDRMALGGLSVLQFIVLLFLIKLMVLSMPSVLIPPDRILLWSLPRYFDPGP